MRHMRILQYVDEVARTGSIRRAASRLHVTASAVNRRIMDLEEELGAPLFERKARGVRLTAAGEVFVRYVREQSADLERTRSHIEDLRGLRRGTVRIACSQALAFDFMPRMIADFRKRHAQVDFDVRVLDHINATAELVNYGVDLALVFRPPPDAAVQSLMAIEQRLVVMMAERHPLSARRTVRLRDCASYPIVLPDRSFGGRQLLEEVWARSSLDVRIIGEFELLRVPARAWCATPAPCRSRSKSEPRAATARASWHGRSTAATSPVPSSCWRNCAGAACRSPARCSPRN